VNLLRAVVRHLSDVVPPYGSMCNLCKICCLRR